MKQEITILLIILLNISHISGNRHEKCCKIGERVGQKNATIVCETNPNVRQQTNFTNTDFFGKNTPGTCIDISRTNKTAIYSVDKSGKKSLKEDAEVKLFPKCCPLGHRYNEILHSCVKMDEHDDLKNLMGEDFFVKIGLPECEIISDKTLNSTKDFNRNDNEIVLLKSSRKFSNGKYCVDSTLDGKFVVRICEENTQICGQIRCIRKCCPDGQSFVNGSKCVDTMKYGVDLHASSKIQDPDAPFVIIHGIDRPIYLMKEDGSKYSIDRAGLFVSYMNKSDTYDYFTVSNQSYCMEHAYKKDKMNDYKMFAKTMKTALETKFSVTRWIKLVSCFFLLLTILVYLMLPKMRNLFGKILVSYSLATFLFFMFLSYSQFFYDKFSNIECRNVGFYSVLSSIWSFTWLNIMCLDIWFSFGTPRTLVGPLQKNEWKRFFYYSLYGWGFPVLLIILIASLNDNPFLPYAIRPFIGDKKCYMENSDSRPGNYAYLLFITLPLLIQQIVNTALFTMTILHCIKIKNEIQRMNDTRRQSDLNASKERSREYHVVLFYRLGLIMKLAVIMGVSFIFETVSSIYDFQRTSVTTYIEVVWDSVNCLQGVFIFIIFICKKKVYDSICERIPILKSRKISVSSTATTQVSLHQIGENKTTREKSP